MRSLYNRLAICKILISSTETRCAAEIARECLRDHQKISNEKLRQLLGLGDSASTQVEASRYVRKWSQEDGFLERHGRGSRIFYSLRRPV